MVSYAEAGGGLVSLTKTVEESNVKVLLLFMVSGQGFMDADCCSGACWEAECHRGERAMA